MTTVSAKVVEDSISEAGRRLVTYQTRYPRWGHAELLTHRSFSRNASSSRATPPDKAIKAVEEDMAIPWHWGLNERGMQANNRLTDISEIRAAVAIWKDAGRYACNRASDLFTLFKLHKQVVNRITEPWSHIDVIITSTDWENFFALRCHPDAEPNIRVLAWRLADLFYKGPSPKPVVTGGWHLPYVTDDERANLPLKTLKLCSAARCARVSYRTHEGKEPDVEKDLELVDRLLGGLVKGDGEPGHMSPFEHQAEALSDPNERSGNLVGWRQHRKEYMGECMTFNYDEAVKKGWRDKALEDAP